MHLHHTKTNNKLHCHQQANPPNARKTFSEYTLPNSWLESYIWILSVLLSFLLQCLHSNKNAYVANALTRLFRQNIPDLWTWMKLSPHYGYVNRLPRSTAALGFRLTDTQHGYVMFYLFTFSSTYNYIIYEKVHSLSVIKSKYSHKVSESWLILKFQFLNQAGTSPLKLSTW